MAEQGTRAVALTPSLAPVAASLVEMVVEHRIDSVFTRPVIEGASHGLGVRVVVLEEVVQWVELLEERTAVLGGVGCEEPLALVVCITGVLLYRPLRAPE